MENKLRNAYDAAFKLKAINLRGDCESDNEETEDCSIRTRKKMILMILVSRRKMKKASMTFPGRIVFFFSLNQPRYRKKKLLQCMYLFMLPYAFN